MAPGNRKTKFSSNVYAALLSAALASVPAFAQTAPQSPPKVTAPAPSKITTPSPQPVTGSISAAEIGAGDDESNLNFSIAGGPMASTAWGVGPALWVDVFNDAPFATGFYEGGFFPHIEISAQAFPGTAPLYQFSLGAQFYSNRADANAHGLRNAWIHGYREIFRSNAVFLEGNFLGLIPFYFSGYHFRFPWGSIDVQWTPFEYLRATRDMMSFAASGAQGAIRADLALRHLVISRVRAGIVYAGYDGLYRTQPGVGMTYGVEAEYQFKITKRFMIGTRLGIDGGLATARDSRTALSTGWSTFGFQSTLFVLRQF